MQRIVEGMLSTIHMVEHIKARRGYPVKLDVRVHVGQRTMIGVQIVIGPDEIEGRTCSCNQNHSTPATERVKRRYGWSNFCRGWRGRGSNLRGGRGPIDDGQAIPADQVSAGAGNVGE